MDVLYILKIIKQHFEPKKYSEIFENYLVYDLARNVMLQFINCEEGYVGTSVPFLYFFFQEQNVTV